MPEPGIVTPRAPDCQSEGSRRSGRMEPRVRRATSLRAGRHARLRPPGQPAGRPPAGAGAAARALPRDDPGERGHGPHRLQRLRRRPRRRCGRARADPVRGRSRLGMAADPPGPATGPRPGHGGHDRHRAHHGRGRRAHPRSQPAAGLPARLDPGLDRRRRRVLHPPWLHAPPAARAHARGRGGHERPGRGPARPRVHRMDRARRLRGAEPRGRVRARDGDRRGGRDRRRAGRRMGAAQRVALDGGALPGRLDRRGGDRVRGRAGARRLGLPRRLPGGSRDRLDELTGGANRPDLPRRPGLGGADRPVRHPRPARASPRSCPGSPWRAWRSP